MSLPSINWSNDKNIERRAKFLKIIFNDYVVVWPLILRWKYCMISTMKWNPLIKHTHVIFSFTDRTELRYRDVRKLETMVFIYGYKENDNCHLLN
ncbi:hypothetical protein KHA80_16480 [Anaerobacillus sp. HL2]|nr:hypothetical protein KHA80_16480 [Anaerobacillus sp. HL2]